MITAVPQTFRLSVQQSGTNNTVNLPQPFRALFGIEKGDVLILRYDPASSPPLVIVDVEKAPRSE